MSHFVICIDRACGSGGKVIGHLTAEKLGIGFYDSNLLDLAKEHGGITSNSLDHSDERATNPFFYKLLYEGNENVEPERPATEMLFQLQSAVIKQVTTQEDCVIVGRCADFVLKDIEDVQTLNVFISSPMNHRIEREMEVDNLSRTQAKAFIRKTDKRRSSYYNCFAKGEWGKKNTYDLILNSDSLGIEGTADILCALYKELRQK